VKKGDLFLRNESPTPDPFPNPMDLERGEVRERSEKGSGIAERWLRNSTRTQPRKNAGTRGRTAEFSIVKVRKKAVRTPKVTPLPRSDDKTNVLICQ
jgi:hypothetical protein